jgi:hypothetical protein
VVEDRPRARRGRVVPIQFVFAHTNGRERNARLRTAGALAQQVRLRLANIKVRTGRSQDTEYGAPGRWELQHITAKTTTARWSCPLLCSGTPPALCIRIAQNSSQLQNSKTSFSSIALACVFSHAPRPMLVEQGTLSWLVARALHAGFLLHDPKAVQEGQATTQDPKDRASGFLSRPATGARANLASTRDFITSPGRLQYSITVLLAGTSYRDRFDSQL